MERVFSAEELILAGIGIRVYGIPDPCDRCGEPVGDGMRYSAGVLCPSCVGLLAEAFGGQLIDLPQWRVFLREPPTAERRLLWMREVRREVFERGPVVAAGAAAAWMAALVEQGRRREAFALIESAFDKEAS